MGIITREIPDWVIEEGENHCAYCGDVICIGVAYEGSSEDFNCCSEQCFDAYCRECKEEDASLREAEDAAMRYTELKYDAWADGNKGPWE